MKDPVSGQPEIGFEFDSEGTRLFEQMTTDYQPSAGQYFQVAIVLDGEICSAPRIQGVISGGRGVIAGSFTAREAVALADALENPLEIPVRIIEEKSFESAH
jgi:SecD/SecF fusion protein